MRITAGRFKARGLATPADARVRPTSDKVRQAIFNVLEHHDFGGFTLAGARIIDLFAGTGALGLEALSRGGRFCLFVEDAAESRGLIRTNVENFGLTGDTKIWRRDATALGPRTNVEPFNLAFLDPPYRKNFVPPALAALRDGDWLMPGALIVAEAAEDDIIPSTDGFALADERTYGDTKVLFFRFGAA